MKQNEALKKVVFLIVMLGVLLFFIIMFISKNDKISYPKLIGLTELSNNEQVKKELGIPLRIMDEKEGAIWYYDGMEICFF